MMTLNDMENNEASSTKEKEIVEQRKKKFIGFFKKNNFIYYVILALITWIAVYIRTRNLPDLKDVTTGLWTLGPDLDPFLFLRWAKYIVQHGSLMAIDTMRYVPLGYDTSGEMKLLSYMIAWFYDFLHIFSKNVTVEFAAIIYPVVMFALTCIAFFFLVRKVLYDSFENKHIPNIIALVSVLFLAIQPALLPRTIAGIPEKESTGFLFIFLVFYFFICAFKAKNYKSASIYGILAGLATAALGLVWGGVTFVFMVVGVSTFAYFLLCGINKKQLLSYFLYTATLLPAIMMFSSRINVVSFLSSTSTIAITLTLILAVFNLFLYPKIKHKKMIKTLGDKYHLPDEIISLLIIGIALAIIATLYFGINFIPEQAKEVIDHLIHPFSTNRFSVTVAENKVPSFVDEWKGNFGPLFFNIPIFFWMFFIGSIWMFYNILKDIEKRDKIILTASYTIFLFCLIFSRYSSSGILNGLSLTSLIIYFGGMLLFAGACGYVYYTYHKNNKSGLLKIDFGKIMMFLFFFISIVAARGGVRLIMVLVPAAGMMAAYLIVLSINFAYEPKKDETKKLFAIIIAIIIFIAGVYSAYYLYESSKTQAEGFYPSMYNVQWQKAMSWVRNNTLENAVFGHWWDYGYWLQSIGNRATVLDGGNAITYWDYFMGREVLTSPDDKTALEFLYAHNTTHYLIDSTDIGKYSAFSSIGSDKNYDRYSYIPTIVLDQKSSKETKNGMLNVYTANSALDEDVVWNENGTKYYFPSESSGLLAILIEDDSNLLNQPRGIFVNRDGIQTAIPLRYLFYNNTMHDFGYGLDAGVFLMNNIQQSSNGQVGIIPNGAGFYLSKKTVHSFLARKYLFGEEKDFQLVYKEQNQIIATLKAQNADIGDFAYFNGNFLGPIKIWKINYPSNVKFNAAYLERYAPKELGLNL